MTPLVLTQSFEIMMLLEVSIPFFTAILTMKIKLVIYFKFVESIEPEQFVKHQKVDFPYFEDFS
jgi:hypothetical protein